jgi:glycosyltransferase involved in cell wall biosynthesis
VTSSVIDRRSGPRVVIELHGSDLRTGAVNDALDLAELAAPSGASFLLCGPLSGEFRAEAQRRGIETRIASSLMFSRRGIVPYAVDVMRWMARLARWRADVVHLNYSGYGPSLACAAWQRGIPVVGRSGPYIKGNQSNKWVSAYAANCHAHAESLLASPLRDRVTVTGDLYRPERLSSTMTLERPLPPKRAGVLRLVFLGQLVERKGLHVLVEALSRVSDPCELLLAGGDWAAHGYPQRIKAMVESLRLGDRVIFENHRQDVGAVLSSADIFVLPSLSEARPRSIIEAMLLGVPVVASNAGGIPSMIADGANGLLVPAGDIEGLARALNLAASSATFRQRLGEAGRMRAERECSPERTARKYLDLYRHVIASRRGAPGRQPALQNTGATTWPM